MTAVEAAAAAAAKLAWMADAACRRKPALRRQLEGYSSTPPSDEALKLCERCPVRRECIEYVFDAGIEYGWLGGIAPSRRRKLKTAAAAIAWLESQGRLRSR